MKNVFSIILLCVALNLSGQNDQSSGPSWDVSSPGEGFGYKNHSFTTTEGTWMNLDISPDGQTIVFDLLGDIYTIPVTGGQATPIRTGIAFEIQPRFSPDGSKISFTSDTGGGDNIWIMNADGTEARQLTHENFRLLNNAVWMPGGMYLVARKHFTSQRSLGAGEMWQYHITGGSGVRLTERKNDQQDVNEPFISPDGQYLYYSEDVYPGGHFQYNKDPNSQIYVIKRYHFKTGETETVTGGPGGAARPTLSPDGTKLAFVKRVRTKSVLYIHDLETGEEWPVFDDLDKDQQEAWAIFGVYPNMAWIPGSKDLVFWSGGKINRINTETLQVTHIPFSVNVQIEIAERLHFENEIPRKNFSPRVIRDAVTAPDGKSIVFQAVGYLWEKKLPDGQPVRLTDGKDFEFEPAFSPDGSQIVFVTWNDQNKGTIQRLDRKTGELLQLTQEKGIYRQPAFAPDGDQIVFRKESGNIDQGFAFTKDPGIYVMGDAGGDDLQKITDQGEYPVFNSTGDRIFLQTGGTYFGALTKKLISVNLDGLDEKIHVTSKYANRLVPSPDERWIAFTHLHKAYIAPLVMNGQTVDLDDQSKYIPVSQIAQDAGTNIHWSPDSKEVFWTLGNQYFRNRISERFTFLPDSPDSIGPISEMGIELGLTTAVDNPEGLIALTNARIITMKDDHVLEKGTILISGSSILEVGPSSSVRIPDDALVYDLSGKTIMPGMVDAHAHIGAFRYGLPAQQNWKLMANLAFGVTTVHDPSANTETVFTLSELQKAGLITGPRIFSTGFILYGADGDFKAVVNNLEDARSHIRRTKAYGAQSVKSYNQPRRDQRQQVLQAAREYKINVVPEGGSTFYHNMTMVIDGHTGIEHNIPVAPVYRDVIELWKRSRVGYTPTLIVNYGGMNGEYYYYQRDNVWENEKLLTFSPRSVIDSRSRHRTMVPIEEYKNGHILVSEAVHTLAEAGVKVNMGAHGQLQGLGAHWELWMLHQGGMSELEALKAATINAAEYIGAGEDIGSLEKGKLADLLILDKNPLDNIENSRFIDQVMINGRLYDAETMNQIGHYEEVRQPFFWEIDGYNAAFPWHQDSHTFQRSGCSCRH